MVGIIFDCDGTLIDSELAHFLSWKQALANQGEDLSQDEYYCYAGKSGAVISRELAERKNIDPKVVLHDKHAAFKLSQEQGIPSIERTIRLVRNLSLQKQNLGIKLGVASAAPKSEILFNLNNLRLLHVFDVVVSGSDDLFHFNDPEGVNKPKPYIYLYAAELLGIDPARCVAFEDSSTGVASARSAGYLTLAVPNSYTKMQDFSSAHHIIPPQEEIDLLEFFQKVHSFQSSSR